MSAGHFLAFRSVSMWDDLVKCSYSGLTQHVYVWSMSLKQLTSWNVFITQQFHDILPVVLVWSVSVCWWDIDVRWWWGDWYAMRREVTAEESEADVSHSLTTSHAACVWTGWYFIIQTICDIVRFKWFLALDEFFQYLLVRSSAAGSADQTSTFIHLAF